MPNLARPYPMAAILTALCLACVVGQADSQADIQAATVTRFTSPGTDMPFVVPDGVTTIHVVAIGGMGGKGQFAPNAGGLGAVVSADIAVTPGQTLFVDVAGNGANATQGIGGSGGLNGGGAGGTSGTATLGKGGGGGGGESGVRSSAGALLSGLIIASGGGGSGGGIGGGGGGSSSVSDGKDGQAGGGGAADTGTAGGSGGGGGTSVGVGSGGHSGQVGAGGAGQDGFDPNAAGAGGGGGAGLFGGGGGASTGNHNSNGGGGGAGSSSSSAASAGGKATNTSYARDTTGVPSVTITYVPSTPGGGRAAAAAAVAAVAAGSALALTSLKASPRTFVAASRGGSTGGTVGTTITYTGSAGATTTFTVLAPRSGIRNSRGHCVRKKHGATGRHCTRYVSVGSFTHTDGAGFNTFVFTGRVRHHKLRSGSYRLQAVAALNGQTTAAVTLSFRIKR